MSPEFLHQDDRPLYPEILYNRPVTRSGAGRLLLPGGHSGDFSQPTALYELIMASGAGECVVALPDVLVKFLSGAPSTTFAESSPSGSLGRGALGRLLELSEDVDAVALGAGLSGNSETAIMVESFLREVQRPVIAFDEALAIMRLNPESLISRADNLIIATMPEVFKLADALGVTVKVQPGGGLFNKLDIIAGLQSKVQATIAVYGTELIISTPDEQPIVTPVNYHLSQYPHVYHALMAVFWTQNRTRRRAGLATAAHLINQISRQVRSDPHPTVAELSKLITTALAQDDF